MHGRMLKSNFFWSKEIVSNKSNQKAIKFNFTDFYDVFFDHIPPTLSVNEKFLRAPKKKSLRHLSNQLCINIFLQCFVFMKYWPHHLIIIWEFWRKKGKKYQKEAIFHSNYYLLWISWILCEENIFSLFVMMPHINFLISHHNWKDFFVL